jgi:hypothetical protein
VTAAYATVKLLDSVTGKWTVCGFYQGAVLPEFADPENVASLVRREYAEWLDAGETKQVDKQQAEEDKAAQEVKAPTKVAPAKAAGK